MRVEGAACLLVGDESLVYEDEGGGEIITIPKIFLSSKVLQHMQKKPTHQTFSRSSTCLMPYILFPFSSPPFCRPSLRMQSQHPLG